MPSAGLAAALALVVGFALWWVYFETLEGAPVDAAGRGRLGVYLTWVYAHLPLAAGIGAGAIGVEHAIRAAAGPALPDPARWLFAGAIALCFAALAVINLAYAAAGGVKWRRPQALSWLVTAAAALGVAAFAARLPASGVIGLIAVASIAQVAIDLWHRSRIRRGTGQRPSRRAAPLPAMKSAPSGESSGGEAQAATTLLSRHAP